MMSFLKAFTTRLILMSAAVLLLNACNPTATKIDLEPKVNQLFSALQKGDIDTALTFYSDKFYKGIPKAEWRKRLQAFIDHMGPITSFRIRNRQADTRFSGKFFVFELETVHEGGKKAEHILTYILPVNEDKADLVAHKITAKGFH
ncbi:MAG: hypothetical protein PVJ39_00715 [Gammaproteobacteria bacterium]|jgi:hypothetical protein